MQSPDSSAIPSQPRHSSEVLLGILRFYFHFLNDEGRAFYSSLESEASVKCRSSTLVWLGNDAVASKLDPSVSNILSTTMSSHSSISPQFDIDPSSSQPTIGSAQYLKKENTPCLPHQKPKASPGSPSSLAFMGAAPKPPGLECPFCSEVGIETVIKRKYDLIRHFRKFHRNNELWRCTEIDCGTNFDWKKPFEMHLEKTHLHAQKASKDSMMKLPPQLVFACGFSNCKTVFEVGKGDDPKEIANKFFEHVADTVDKRNKDNLPPLDWKYQVRFRNLMRQESVDQHWKDRRKGHSELVWQPHSSFVLRKDLETRRFSDIPLLVQRAIELGSLPLFNPDSPISKPPQGLAIHIEDDFYPESSGYGSGCSADVHPDSPMDHPAPPPTGPMDLDEASLQLPPASPRYFPAHQTSAATTPRYLDFDLSYHGCRQASPLQSQVYPNHNESYSEHTRFCPSATNQHDSTPGFITDLPAQQRPSLYPVGPLEAGPLEVEAPKTTPLEVEPLEVRPLEARPLENDHESPSPGFVVPWYDNVIDPQLSSMDAYTSLLATNFTDIVMDDGTQEFGPYYS